MIFIGLFELNFSIGLFKYLKFSMCLEVILNVGILHSVLFSPGLC